MGFHPRGFPHPAVAEIIVIIHQRLIGPQGYDGGDDEESSQFFHLFYTFNLHDGQM